MNDPQDIVLQIALEEEKKQRLKESTFLNESIEEDDNQKNSELNDESEFNNILAHLYENLSKKLFKKTIKEINVLIEKKYLEEYSCAWKITILKIRALLKIIKNKIIKYLIYHHEKAKLKNHIHNIKNYFKNVLNEINIFLDNIDEKLISNSEIIDNLLFCYFEYIYLISFFHKKLGNIMNSISYLSLIKILFKETQLIPKSMNTFNKIEKCFILLSQFLIYNEDYFNCFEYLNIAMDLCLKDIIYQTKDLSEGVFQGDKKKIKDVNNYDETMADINKNKFDNELENNFGNKDIKKVIINIVYIYFYRGICYENIGKIKNSVRCYTQCLWFLNHFFVNNYKNFFNLIKKILKKSLEFKEAIDYLNKKIYYYECIQRLNSKRGKYNKEKEEKNGNKSSKHLYSKKFKRLVDKIDKFKINEIDTVNKFEIKKNIKILNSVKREGKDKNIFLSDIRLLNIYLREDFRVIIDKMDIIKSYDLDYQTRQKIQKLIRNIHFEQSQRKLRIQRKNKIKNNFNQSSINLNNSKKYELEEIRNKRYELINNNNPKIVVKSAFSRGKKSSLFPSTCKSFSKNQSINFKNINKSLIKNKSALNIGLKKYGTSRLNSSGPYTSKSKIFEENKQLNSFFNKKYTSKRNYIKKLADRELTFQKSILRLKNVPKTPMQMYNKEIVKQNTNDSFQKIMSLLMATPVDWKEQMSEKEVKEIMAYDKLQNAVIKSLDKSALVKYKEEEKKQKNKINYNSDEFNLSIRNVNNNNKNLIDRLNSNLEELKYREIMENKNYQKMLDENWKNLKYKVSHNMNSSCIVCKRMNEKKSNSRNNKLKKSNSLPYFYS